MLDGKILILDDYKTDGYIQNKYIYIYTSLSRYVESMVLPFN
jgi:hypothetical protein